MLAQLLVNTTLVATHLWSTLVTVRTVSRSLDEVRPEVRPEVRGRRNTKSRSAYQPPY